MRDTAPAFADVNGAGVRTGSWPALGAPLLTGAACWLAAVAGHAIRLPDTEYAIIRPASAVLVAALLLSPPRRWPVFLAAALPAQLLAHPGAPPAELAMGYLHRAALAVVAAWLVRSLGPSPIRLDRLRDMVAFVILAGVAAPAAVATAASAVFPAIPGGYARAWWINFFANALAVLLLVPPLAAACQAVAAGRRPRARAAVDAALPVIGLAAASVLALDGWSRLEHLHHALLLAPLPFLLWAGVRFGPAGAGASLTVLAMAAAWSGMGGPFASGTPYQIVFSIQSFLLAVSVPVLFLAALNRERDGTVAALRSSEARNRAILSALPDMMFLQDREGRYLDYHAPDPSVLLHVPGGFLGRRMEEMLPPGILAPIRRCLAEAMETGGPCVVEYPLEVRGEPRHYEARLVRCGPDSVLSIVRDITARVAAEASVRARERALRRAHAQARALARRLITSQEEERRRIARDIHDDFSQQVAALSLTVSLIVQRLPAGLPSDAPALSTVQERIAALAAGLRTLSHQLHPVVLEYAGLAPALRSHCDEVGRLTGLACRVDFEGEALSVPPEVALGAYRVAQEALRNVVRHAAAAEARVTVSHAEGELRLTVRDDGAGFDAGKGGRPPGLGLVSMDERVRLLGGTLRVRSRPGAGTEVTARIPLRRRSALAEAAAARGSGVDA